MIDWDNIRRYARSTERPPEWPQNVHGITQNGLNLLGLDEQTRLHWDGKPLVIEQRLTFSRWQKLLGALSVLALTLGATAQGVDAGHNFGCKLQWLTWGCPAKAASVEAVPTEPPPPAAISYGSGIGNRAGPSQP
jgi:hypothetical protein